MAKQHLHIVSFDVPYPADYGGVIDVFFKVEALSKSGVQIHLHCFQYGRPEQKRLEELCASIYYYERNTRARMLFSRKPYIVKSRSNQDLLSRLLGDDHPILFEGLHTSAIIDHPDLKERFKLLRTHNVEHDYYRGLAHRTPSLHKRMYYAWEAKKLKRFEKVVGAANVVLAISKDDLAHFSKRNDSVKLVYPFHVEPTPHYVENPKPAAVGMESDYYLYQGNLEVEENREAAQFLIEQVSPGAIRPMVFAGRGAAKFGATFESTKVKFIDSPSDDEMLRLSRNASIHLLPTFQSTGFKLKLLYALSTGRHVLVNDQMTAGTDLADFCHTANTSSEWITQINDLEKSTFAQSKFDARQAYLYQHYSNEKLAQVILGALPELLH